MTIERIVEKLKGLQRYEATGGGGGCDSCGYGSLALLEESKHGEAVKWDDITALVKEIENDAD